MEKTIQMYESSNIAQRYSKFRPTHPEPLLEKIFAFSAKHGVGNNMAMDLACGPGQSTFPLCGRFHRTVGVDISKAQIDCALEKKKALSVSGDVEFVVSSASDLPFEDESVDVITCGVAWHWLDPDTVFPEIDRVLKRPGVLAVYCHGHLNIHQKKCNQLLSDFYTYDCIWQDGPYGNVANVCGVSQYRDVELPYSVSERHDMQQESTMSLENLKGFVSSLDCYEPYRKQHPGTTALEDMLLKMKMALLEEEKAPNEIADNTELKFRASTPYYLLLALKN